MRLCFVGTGYVGLVSAICFADKGHHVICVDNNPEKIEKLNQGISPIFEPGLDELIQKNIEAKTVEFTMDLNYGVDNGEVIFIAVGTPSLPNGEADLSQVTGVAETIAKTMKDYKIIINKSTVPVGTGDMVTRIIRENQTKEIPFDVVSNPEFLREGCAIGDTMHPDRVIVGSENQKAGQVIVDLHKDFGAPVLHTNRRTAEMIKYASNAFLATKISFINEISNICEKVGADVTLVADGMGLDRRIGNQFLKAGVGYGGSCFPKDTKALIQIAGNAEHDFQLLKSVVKVNNNQRFKVIDKLLRFFNGNLEGITIGILGLAFKPDTDDMRDAPSTIIISHLKKAGAKVKAYDPVAMEQAQKIISGITYTGNAYEAVEGAHAVVLVTEWKEFLNMDMAKVRESMAIPCFIDGRNVLDPEKMKAMGFKYFCIGRPCTESAVEADTLSEAAAGRE